MELPEPTALRALIAKSRAKIVRFDERLLNQLMLEIGPDDRGRELRTEGQAPPTFVSESIHLFGDNVGSFANTPREELCVLKNGGSDLLVAIPRGKTTHNLLHVKPLSGLRRKNVDCSSRSS